MGYSDAMGYLDVLNCNAGHIRVSFDKDDVAEVAKAKTMIQDMMRRGYSILVETDDGTWRVNRFDPTRCEYIVEDATPDAPKKTRRLPVRSTRATAVGRTAGG